MLLLSAARLLFFVAMLSVYWLECGENPVVFCYRIGEDLLAPFAVARWNQPSACSSSSEA
jgi:hypothetical protein